MGEGLFSRKVASVWGGGGLSRQMSDFEKEEGWEDRLSSGRRWWLGDRGEVRLPTPVIEAVSQTNMLPWDEARGRLALASILPRSLRIMNLSFGVSNELFLPQVVPGVEWLRQWLQAPHIAASSREGIDNGIHSLAVRVQCLSVWNKVGILSNFVQP